MLLYIHLISNGLIIQHVTHDVDIPGCYYMHIFSAMRLVYYIVRYIIDMSG